MTFVSILRRVEANPRYLLAGLLLAAALARLVLLLGFPDIFAFDQTGAVHGSDAYDIYAQNLLATGVYGRTPGVPDASIPPLYSYALAGVYAIFGRGFVQAGVFHIILDLISITCLYYLGKKLFPRGEAVGLLAGLMTAFYPYLIFQNLTLIDTPFFMALTLVFLLLMVLLRERPALDRGTWLLAVAGGLALGAATLARPILPPLAVLVALWFLFRLNLWQTILRLLPVALISLALLGVWIARNYAIFEAFIPMSTTSGANFWQGNSRFTVPFFRAGYDVQWTSPTPDMTTEDLYSREADAERFALGYQYWRENPEKLPELFWVKFLVHWSIDIAPLYNPNPGERLDLDDNGQLIIRRADANGQLLTFGDDDPVNVYVTDPRAELMRTIHRFYWGGLFLLGLVGVVVSFRLWRDVSLLWLVQISMTAVYVFFHPSTRYRVPTDPLWFLLSAYALVWLWARWRGRGKAERI